LFAFAARKRWRLRDNANEMIILAKSWLNWKFIRKIRSTCVVPEIGSIIATQIRAISAFDVSIYTLEIFVRVLYSPD
jgi:hypothetical protein